MERVKAFLKRKQVVISVQTYLIDALGAMAFGLFASLLIGTIFGTLGEKTGVVIFTTIAGYAKSATGAALGAMRFPVYVLRQVFYRLAALWDVIFYALAGLAVFAAGQWCSGGVRPRFLTAAIVGCALCTYLLTPLRRPVRRLAERKRKHSEEQRCRKENERKKSRKKFEKISMQNRIYRLQ